MSNGHLNGDDNAKLNGANISAASAETKNQHIGEDHDDNIESEGEELSESPHSKHDADADVGEVMDGDEDENRNDIEQYIALLHQSIALNPCDYSKHAELVNTLRTALSSSTSTSPLSIHPSDLRDARENMYQYFPLPPTMWKEWIRDEQQYGDDNQQYVLQIYENALNDYIDIELYVDYCQYGEMVYSSEIQYSFQDNDANQNINRVRQLYDKALNVAKYHVTQGTSLFDAYRAFENRVSESMMNVDSEENEQLLQQQLDALQQQNSKIEVLYHTQLSYPHTDNEATYNSYTEWCVVAEIAPNISIHESYKASQRKYQEIESYELQLQHHQTAEAGVPTAELWRAWQTYIQHAQQQLTPASGSDQIYALVALYERCVSQCFLVSTIWQQYATFAAQHSPSEVSRVADIYRRATRNLPHDAELVRQYIQSLERLDGIEGAPNIEKVNAVIERIIALNLPVSESLLYVYVTGATYFHRRSTGEQQRANELLSDAHRLLKYADVNVLKSLDNEVYIDVYDLWSHIPPNDIGDGFRRVFREWLSVRGSVDSSVWLRYVERERFESQYPECRKLYAESIEALRGGSAENWHVKLMCNEWIRFERVYGTTETHNQANEAVLPIVSHFQTLKANKAAKLEKQQQQSQVELQQLSRSRSRSQSQARSKPHARPTLSEAQWPQDMSNTTIEATSKTLQHTINEATSEASFAAASGAASEMYHRDSKRKRNANADPPKEGPVKHSRINIDDNTTSVQRDTRPAPSQFPVKHHTPLEAAQNKSIAAEPNTIFVLNLPYEYTTMEHVRQLFSSFGTILDVVVSKKGFAWVQFDTKKSMMDAINGMNNYPVSGRELQVKKSEANPRRTASESAKVRDVTQRTVYVKRIPTNCDDIEHQLTNAFGKCGVISSLRLHRRSNGKYDNYCFIEFTNEAAANKAIILYNDQKLLPPHHPRAARQQPMSVSLTEDRSKQAKHQEEATTATPAGRDHINTSSRRTDASSMPPPAPAGKNRSVILNVRASSTLLPRHAIAPPSITPTQRLRPISAAASASASSSTSNDGVAMNVDQPPVDQPHPTAPPAAGSMTNEDFRRSMLLSTKR